MPYSSSLPDTLLVDGTDLQSLNGIVFQDLSGLFAPGTRRGQDDVIPGRNGVLGAELPYDAYSFDIPLTVLPDDASGPVSGGDAARKTQMIANLRALAAACVGTNGLVTLTRRLTNTAAMSGYDEHTANGRVVTGLALQMLNMENGRTVLQIVNLDGCWFDASAPTVPIVP